MRAAGDLYCPDVDQRRRLVKAKVKQRKAASSSGTIQTQRNRHPRTAPRKVFTTPNVFPPPISAAGGARQPRIPRGGRAAELLHLQTGLLAIHHFYDQLCPACAELNFRKRTELADLRGRVALLTGGRVKIGYQAGIKLLACGAHLIVTTRFPRDSAARYSQEPDFEQWGDRLEIFGLDLRHTPSVEAFCRHLLATQPRLDFIINNACQTVRRPPEFYAHMMGARTGRCMICRRKSQRLLGAYEGLRG